LFRTNIFKEQSPMSKQHGKPTHKEIIERERLKAIASDSTLSEPERELAREQMQALRDAAIARSELRKIKSAKSANEPEPDLPEKPLHLEGESAEDFAFRVEHWNLKLDEAAAQKVLDSPKSNLVARQNAERTLKKCAKRRKALFPEVDSEDSTQTTDAPAQSDVVNDNRPWAEKNPFQTHHKPGTELYRYYLQEWEHKCAFSEMLAASSKLKRENPAEWQRQWDAEKAAEDERYARCQGGHQQSQPFIATPLQTATWKAQSEKFAELRGEASPEPPKVEPPQPDLIFVLDDDFMFYGDSTEATLPFPLGVKFVRAPFPPGYQPGDKKISPCYRYDRMSFSWWRV
jgi:hypothetical protein